MRRGQPLKEGPLKIVRQGGVIREIGGQAGREREGKEGEGGEGGREGTRFTTPQSTRGLPLCCRDEA